MPDQVATPANTPVAPAPTQAPAQQNGAAKPETPAEAKYRLKVGGEERDYTRAEVEKFAGKGAFADKAIKAAKERAEALAKKEEEIAAREKLWDDDDALEAELERRGKLDKLALKRANQKIAEQQKTPEELRAEKAEREAQALRDEKAKREQSDKAAKQAHADRVLAQQMQTQLIAAAEAAGFEKSPDAFYALAEVVQEFKRHKIPWDAERVVEIAQDNINDAFKRLESSVTKSLKGAKLKERLGPVVWKEVLRHAAEEIRSGGPRATHPPRQQPPPEQKREAPPTPEDIMNKWRGR